MNFRRIGLSTIILAIVPMAAAPLARPVAASSRPAPALSAGASPRPTPMRTPLPRPPEVAGYVWSYETSGGYYSFNSLTGSTGVSVVAVFPPGRGYFVNFASLGAVAGGTVDVTQYGAPGTCSPALWTTNNTDWSVFVRCYSLAGARQAALFDLAYAEPTAKPGGVLDFDLVSASGSLREYRPYQYDSSHKANTVKHLGTGRYRISMPGPPTRGITGTVKVTPAFLASGDCEIAGWHGTPAGQVIDVDCFSVTGARQNTPFTVTYVRHDNLLGLSNLTSAYAFANRPTDAATYRPAAQYSSHDGAFVSVTRLSRGTYVVSFHGSAGPVSTNGGDVQLSAVGSSDHHCYVLRWTTNPSAYVNCQDNSGSPADTAFTIQWVVG